METLPTVVQQTVERYVGVYEDKIKATMDWFFKRTTYSLEWSSGCACMERERRRELPPDDPDHLPYPEDGCVWESHWDFKEARKMGWGYLQDFNCVALKKIICLAHLKQQKGTATVRDKIYLLLAGFKAWHRTSTVTDDFYHDLRDLQWEMYKSMPDYPVTETILPIEYQDKIIEQKRMDEEAEAMRRERREEVEGMYGEEAKW